MKTVFTACSISHSIGVPLHIVYIPGLIITFPYVVVGSAVSGDLITDTTNHFETKHFCWPLPSNQSIYGQTTGYWRSMSVSDYRVG